MYCNTLLLQSIKDPVEELLRVYFWFQAPAVDVVAVGLSDGHIILHNIKFDETITKFVQDWGPVTTISFRTGNTCGFTTCDTEESLMSAGRIRLVVI